MCETDLRKIISDDDVFFESACNVFESFNEQQLVPMRFQDSIAKVLVSNAGKFGPCEYLDPSTSEVVTVDHFARVIKSIASTMIVCMLCKSFV